MWRRDGTKLTGDYGTWNDVEHELHSWVPANGTLILVKEGGDSPGPEWDTTVFPHRFARTPYHHFRRVPALEVSDVNSVKVTGFMGPGRELVIISEDDEGNLAVEASNRMAALYKRQLSSNHGFKPMYENEPLERTMVFGWLPAQRITNIERRTVLHDTPE